MKSLIKYIVDSFWNELVKFEYLASIHSLKVKYEQVFSFSFWFLQPLDIVLLLMSVSTVFRALWSKKHCYCVRVKKEK